jgi:N-acetylglucosaminyldiphosphoundecaprenol N-acetyl-beta-D-mannosaminyltransferase
MSKIINILGINFNNVTMKQAIEKIKEFLNEDKLHIVYTPNSEIIMASKRIKELHNILNSADLIVPDGAGVVIGSKILGTPLLERVAGYDLITNMFIDDEIKLKRFFLLGAKQETVEKASENLIKLGINICGHTNGYFAKDDEIKIIEYINSSKADILLVALGAPKQEIWLNEHKEKINVRLSIGVGGSFDIIAGISKRAPDFFCKNNLEWFYRLYKEPWRFWRMLDLPKFILHVIFYSFLGKYLNKY